MPQSLAHILVHLVFSTKNRDPLLGDSIHEELHAYIGGIIANHEGALLKAGSVPDHIHLLLVHPRTYAPAKLVQEIKTGSNRWLKGCGKPYAAFSWQSGYGIFSVSPSHRLAFERYLEGQGEHHKKASFQDEYRRLLRKYGIEWNEHYFWD